MEVINRNEVEKTVLLKGSSVPSTVTWYEISSAGIDRIGRTELINPGPFRTGRYAYVEIADGSVKADIRRIGKR